MILNRNCIVCGEELEVKIDDKTRKILTKGIFYAKMKLPANDAKVIKEWEEDVFGNGEKFKVVKYDKYEEMEYWECPKCCEDD